MSASFTVAWSEVRRRRLQSAVMVVMVALASGTITLGLNLLLESRSPYDRAFDAQRGAHLRVHYDSRRVTPAQLASTPATIGAAAAAGPWPSVYVAWVLPSQVEDLAGGDGLGYEMAYAFRDPPTGQGSARTWRGSGPACRRARSPGPPIT